MTFKEEIELQLKDNKVLSYEILSQLKEKNYYSGKLKEEGDTVLFGLLEEISNNENETNLNLITFHEEEIGVFYEENSKYYKEKKGTTLPYIKLMEKWQ